MQKKRSATDAKGAVTLPHQAAFAALRLSYIWGCPPDGQVSLYFYYLVFHSHPNPWSALFCRLDSSLLVLHSFACFVLLLVAFSFLFGYVKEFWWSWMSRACYCI
jgi:hypothetical protein